MRVLSSRPAVIALAAVHVLVIGAAGARVTTVTAHKHRVAAAKRAEHRALTSYAKRIAPVIDRALAAALPVEEVLIQQHPDPYDPFAARDVLRRTSAGSALQRLADELDRVKAPPKMNVHKAAMDDAFARMVRSLTALRSPQEHDHGDALFDRLYGPDRGFFLGGLNDLDDAAKAVYATGQFRHGGMGEFKVVPSRESWIAAADRACGRFGDATLTREPKTFADAQKALSKQARAARAWVSAIRAIPLPRADASVLRSTVLSTLAIADQLNVATQQLSTAKDPVSVAQAFSRFEKLAGQMRAVNRGLRSYGASLCWTILTEEYDLTGDKPANGGDVTA
ncbi:MAG: hypothetical protein QOJ92_2735 [Frankiales bacterium]|nr:hypothetical protein [Frankiales bacterium]